MLYAIYPGPADQRIDNIRVYAKFLNEIDNLKVFNSSGWGDGHLAFRHSANV